MGWLKARGDRVEVWRLADHYFDIWMANDRCGAWRMRTITGVNLQKMIRKFESGWVPAEDDDWRAWCEQTAMSEQFVRSDK